MVLAPLRFRPFIITNFALLFFITATIPCIVLLGIALGRGPIPGPAILFDGVVPGYISTVFKTVTILQIDAYHRVIPFCDMNSTRTPRQTAKRTLLTACFPRMLSLGFPRLGRLEILLNIIASLGVMFIQQLAGNLFRRHYAINDEGRFDLVGWVTNRGVVFGVIFCLVAFDVVAFSILMWFRGRATGLAAQPGSIATLLGMVRGAKYIWEDFHGLDIEPLPQVFKERLGDMKYHIYPDKHLGKYVLDKKVERSFYKRSWNRTDGQPVISRTCHNTRLARFDYIPWFLRTTAIVSPTTLLFASFITALKVTHNSASYEDGFDPLISTIPIPYLDLSPADLLWSLLPVFIALLLTFTLKDIDTFYRIVQPYADLYCGNAPFQTLEINYCSDPFPIVTIKAIGRGHWRVALSSVLAFISVLLPIYAISMFYIGYSPNYDAKRVLISPSAFRIAIGAMAFLGLAFLPLIPTRLYFMPHRLETLADHISMIQRSGLLREHVFTFAPDDTSFIRTIILLFTSKKSGSPGDIRNQRFALGVRKYCDRGVRCVGPHSICIDICDRLECYYTSSERKRNTAEC